MNRAGFGGSLQRAFARCLLCHGGDPLPAGICAPCAAELPDLDAACQRCALPLANSGDSHCARCQSRPPPVTATHACWFYAYPVAQLIQRFKYQRDLAAGRTLAELAAARLNPESLRPTLHHNQHHNQHPNQHPDLLIPVPMHWRKQLFERGYNQAQLIADILARQWQIPVDNRALRKITRTGSQQELKRAQRLKNLVESFSAHPRVRGLHIGLVDDVITTGATAEAAAGSLRAAGATSVTVYALARVP